MEADRDHLVGVTMADVGDLAIQGSDTEGNYTRITGAARRIAERGALMVAIGGTTRSACRSGGGWSRWAGSTSFTWTPTPTSWTSWTARA